MYGEIERELRTFDRGLGEGRHAARGVPRVSPGWRLSTKREKIGKMVEKLTLAMPAGYLSPERAWRDSVEMTCQELARLIREGDY